MCRVARFSVLTWIGLSVITNAQITTVKQNTQNSSIYRDGDLIIGGLIPVHFTSNSAQHPGAASCGGSLHPRGYIGAEAMLYAIETINNSSEILPYVTLGVDIKDSCGSVDYAIMECLNFDFIRTVFASEAASSERCSVRKDGNSSTAGLQDSATLSASGTECCGRKSRHTVAIVGAAFSGVTMAIASLAGLFYIPVVSFASTSRLLGDRARFRYFYRTVPSDTLQAKAMVDIIHTFQWSFVITVASDNEYGRSGISALKEMAQRDQRRHVCVVVDELFSRRGSKKHIKKIFDKIKKYPNAKVIIVYAEFPDAKYFLEEAKAAGLRDYVFIASDSWAGSVDVVRGLDNVISSVICLRPPIVPIPKFKSQLQKKLSSNVSEHHWTEQYKKYIAHVCNGSAAGTCHTGIHNDGYIPYIMDAVSAIAHALHSLLGCTKNGCPKTFNQELLRHLPSFIQNVSIEGYSNKQVTFDEFGGAKGSYDLYSLKIHNGDYDYEKFGRWSPSGLSINKRLIRWNNMHNSQPDSKCSKNCRRGEIKVPLRRFPECCWRCEKCTGRTYTNTTNTRNCVECPIGTWPNVNNSGCFPIDAEYLRWEDRWAIVILTFSGIGVLAVVVTVIVFIKFHATAVVRAASQHLCFVLLTGICLFFLTPVVFVMKPSKISCMMLPFMIGLCFSMVVGTILIKTNRISRIFNEKLLQTGRIACLGNEWQLLLMGGIVAVEIIVCLCWVRGSSTTPFPEARYSVTSQEATLTCNLSASKIGFSVWLIYNAGLVIICTYQAFLVRKVPQNYNESRFIAFTMITICITVLVYVPSYLGTSAWYRTVISCFMFVFLGSVTWISIFIPKLHIILFRPHKNIPMRPSVSSVTLGVFDRSPTVVSNYSDSTMRSRSNTEGSGNEVRGVDTNCHESRNGKVARKDKERGRKTSQVRFKDEWENSLSKIPLCECNEENHDVEDTDSNRKRCPSCGGVTEQKVIKKQSVVRFNDDGEVVTSPWVRGTDVWRPGILRRPTNDEEQPSKHKSEEHSSYTVYTNADKKAFMQKNRVLTESMDFEDQIEERINNLSFVWEMCNGAVSYQEDSGHSYEHRESKRMRIEEAEIDDNDDVFYQIELTASPGSKQSRKISVFNQPSLQELEKQAINYVKKF